MSDAPPLLLVDTNVWLDEFLPERPNRAASLTFFEEAVTADACLLYPSHIISDVFYFICNELKRAVRQQGDLLTEHDALAIRHIAWACIDRMRELGTAVGTDESDIWLASKWRTQNGDLEDNLVRAAAQRSGASLVVTNDRQMLAKAYVPTVTPADAIAWLQGL